MRIKSSFSPSRPSRYENRQILRSKHDYFRLHPTIQTTKKDSESKDFRVFPMVAGVGFEPHDLRVMSPTSYRTALPRDIVHRQCLYIIPCFCRFVKPPFLKIAKPFSTASARKKTVGEPGGEAAGCEKSFAFAAFPSVFYGKFMVY